MTRLDEFKAIGSKRVKKCVVCRREFLAYHLQVITCDEICKDERLYQIKLAEGSRRKKRLIQSRRKALPDELTEEDIASWNKLREKFWFGI